MRVDRGLRDAGAGAPDANAEPVHAYLRAATAQQHERVEALVDLDAATASRAAYVALLRRYLGFQRPLEARLVATPFTSELPFELVLRAPRIEQDLNDLAPAASVVPACEALPALESREALAGCLYVIEGAALGGRVIANHARKRLGLDRAGLRFFAGTGDLRERWASVLGWLATLDAREAIVSGARATFDALARWLEHGA